MRAKLCELIWAGGYWSEQLAPGVGITSGYSSEGYLLIVGEGEIVPTWNHGDFDISWAHSETSRNVDYCDTDYGDSNGNWLPEIIVGRVIGDSANALRTPIDASIAVAEGDADYDRSNALLISGYGDHYTVFEDNVADLRAYLHLPSEVTIKMHDFFELDRFGHAWTRYDGLAIGDVTGGADKEIVISKDDNHMLYVYNRRGNLLMDEAYPEFDGDCILRTQRGPGFAYIAILDPAEGLIRTRSADGSDTGTRSITAIQGYCDFAVGDVDGDGEDEYVVASDATNTIYVYDSGSDSSFSFDFTSQDSLAVGNVMGDGKEEIVIAKDEDNTIKIYDRTGLRLGTITSGDSTYYSPADRLAVGDVCGDAMEEIVIAMDDDGFIRAYDATGELEGKVDLGFTRYDQLALGDLVGDSKEEIVLARDDDSSIVIADLYYESRIIDEIRRLSPESDVIFFSGHGNVNNWNCFGTGNVPADFGTATPFVYAVTCLSGNYVGEISRRDS